MKHWSVEELATALTTGEKLRLIDVREPEEFAICQINGAELIPMSELPVRAADILSTTVPVILYCHHGVRSEYAMRWLHAHGAQNIGHLVGGIDAWAERIAPAMPRY